jgi:L-threonylcarbamoyladenylate synthase
MEILKMKESNIDLDAIDHAIDILSNGGIIIYPTDTVYGLGANIFNDKSMEKIYKIKNRDKNHPISACFSSIDAISVLIEKNKLVSDILKKNLPGSFTFIVHKKRGLGFKFLDKNNHKIGVRLPKSKIATELSKIFPITSTSANISSMKTLSTPKEIIKQLNYDVDLAINIGSLKNDKFSTVVDLLKLEPKILRNGSGNLII